MSRKNIEFPFPKRPYQIVNLIFSVECKTAEYSNKETVKVYMIPIEN
jgi:hypothetical protein